MLVLNSDPATPDKAGLANSERVSVGLVSSEKHAAATAAAVKRTPEQEPSPASTYGETVIGGSVPVTPFPLNGMFR